MSLKSMTKREGDMVVKIDGSQGEGGGQIVRSSLALSLVTGRPVAIDNIRAGRKKPGLMRQHLTALRAAAEVGAAEIDGDEIGSRSLVFRPRTIRAGEYTFAVGTAGSATLVLQTVLPALLVADGPSTLTLEGGTHNPWAPPFDFLTKVFLPLVNRMGPKVFAEIERHGFYPAGGGRFTVRIEPSRELTPFRLLERGEIISRSATALVANLPRAIAERELDRVARKTNWPAESFRAVELTNVNGQGNAIMIEVASQNVTEMFTGFGRYGVKAENVAREALDQLCGYLSADVPVGRYLADQLLLPLGIAAWKNRCGSAFRTLPLTRHAQTHLEVLKRFLNVPIHVQQHNGTCSVMLGTQN